MHVKLNWKLNYFENLGRISSVKKSHGKNMKSQSTTAITSSQLRRNTSFSKNVIYSSSPLSCLAQWWKVCTNQKTENLLLSMGQMLPKVFGAPTNLSCNPIAYFYLYFGMMIPSNGTGLRKEWTESIFSVFGAPDRLKRRRNTQKVTEQRIFEISVFYSFSSNNRRTADICWSSSYDLREF